MTAEEAANMITRTLLSVRPSDADRDDLVGRVLEPIAEARMFHRRPIEGKWMEEVLRRVNVTMEKAHIEERKEQQQPSDDDVENLSAALGQLYQTMLKNRGCSVELVGSDSEGDKEIDSSLGSDIDPKDDGSDVMVEITPRDANYVCGMEEALKIQEEMEMLKQHPGMLQDCEVPPFYFGIASLNMDDLTYVVIQASNSPCWRRQPNLDGQPRVRDSGCPWKLGWLRLLRNCSGPYCVRYHCAWIC
eukprot:282043_1